MILAIEDTSTRVQNAAWVVLKQLMERKAAKLVRSILPLLELKVQQIFTENLHI